MVCFSSTYLLIARGNRRSAIHAPIILPKSERLVSALLLSTGSSASVDLFLSCHPSICHSMVMYMLHSARSILCPFVMVRLLDSDTSSFFPYLLFVNGDYCLCVTLPNPNVQGNASLVSCSLFLPSFHKDIVSAFFNLSSCSTEEILVSCIICLGIQSCQLLLSPLSFA